MENKQKDVDLKQEQEAYAKWQEEFIDTLLSDLGDLELIDGVRARAKRFKHSGAH